MPPRPSVTRGRSELVEAAPSPLRCLLGGDDVVGLQRPDVVAGPVRDRVPVGGSPSSLGKATAPPPPAPRRPASPRWRSAQRAALAPRRPARRALRCRCPRASRRRWRRAGGTARASCDVGGGAALPVLRVRLAPPHPDLALAGPLPAGWRLPGQCSLAV